MTLLANSQIKCLKTFKTIRKTPHIYMVIDHYMVIRTVTKKEQRLFFNWEIILISSLNFGLKMILLVIYVPPNSPSWVLNVNTQNKTPYNIENFSGTKKWMISGTLCYQTLSTVISSHWELNLKEVKNNGESWRKLWKIVLCFQFHLVLQSWTLKWFIHVLKKPSDSHFLIPSWILGAAFPNSNHQKQIRTLDFIKIK